MHRAPEGKIGGFSAKIPMIRGRHPRRSCIRRQIGVKVIRWLTPRGGRGAAGSRNNGWLALPEGFVCASFV
jgi:hypothetical protein